MKRLKLYWTILILTVSKYTYAQISQDSTVVNYIKEQSKFVRITDIDRLPKSIKPLFSTIRSYMNTNKMVLTDYWTSATGIQEYPNSILIPLYHYRGFVLEKQLEEEEKRLNMARVGGDTIIVIGVAGNPSGKDGILEIDKNEKRVVSFKLWQ